MPAIALSVRVVHVVGMAVLLGGGVFAWNELRTRPEPPIVSLVAFEWVFWGTTGLMLVTGVGNLGAVGAPGPDTRWGGILSIKLVLVLGFVIVSILRTHAVRRVRDRPVADADAVAVRRLYAGTVWLLLAVVVLAEVLAHG